MSPCCREALTGGEVAGCCAPMMVELAAADS
jgi:hypothetical protein